MSVVVEGCGQVGRGSRQLELIAKCKDANVDLVVLEATGGCERGLMCALQGAGITVALRHNTVIKAFLSR